MVCELRIEAAVRQVRFGGIRDVWSKRKARAIVIGVQDACVSVVYIMDQLNNMEHLWIA